jgi:hypothetical protein
VRVVELASIITSSGTRHVVQMGWPGLTVVRSECVRVPRPSMIIVFCVFVEEVNSVPILAWRLLPAIERAGAGFCPSGLGPARSATS